MADIFNVSPPAWLVDATRSSEKGLLGGIAGSLVAGGIVAGEKAASENEQRNWFQLLPESIAEAKMSFLDPMWRIKLQQTQLGIANTGLQMQEAQQRINMQATEIRNEAEDVQTIPNWLRDHNTPESRETAIDRPVPRSAKWQRYMQQIDQNDIAADRAKNASTLGKVTFNGLKELSNAVDEISKYDGVKGGVLSSKIAPYAAQGTMPPAEILAEVSVARQEAQAKKTEEAKKLIEARGAGVPVGERYRRIADEEDSLAEEARLKGDVEGYQRHKQRADENRANAAPKVSTTEITMGPEGPKVVQTYGQKATGAMATEAQKKIVRYEDALTLINRLQKTLTPADVGPAGVAGEMVLDVALPAFGVDKFYSGARVQHRTALGALRESLLRQISDDPRFSNVDRETISNLLPKTGIFESYPAAMDRMAEVRDILTSRIGAYSGAAGASTPASGMTRDQIIQQYESTVKQLKDAVDSNRMTQRQAEEQYKKVRQGMLDALERFH